MEAGRSIAASSIAPGANGLRKRWKSRRWSIPIAIVVGGIAISPTTTTTCAWSGRAILLLDGLLPLSLELLLHQLIVEPTSRRLWPLLLLLLLGILPIGSTTSTTQRIGPHGIPRGDRHRRAIYRTRRAGLGDRPGTRQPCHALGGRLDLLGAGHLDAVGAGPVAAAEPRGVGRGARGNCLRCTGVAIHSFAGGVAVRGGLRWGADGRPGFIWDGISISAVGGSRSTCRAAARR